MVADGSVNDVKHRHDQGPRILSAVNGKGY